MNASERALLWVLDQQNEDGGILAGPEKPYVYAEVTGYFVKAALTIDGLEEECFSAAKYLVANATNGFIRWNGVDDVAYTFDTAIIADALMDAFEYTYQDRYYSTAVEMMRRLEMMLDTLGHLPTMSNSEGRAWNEPNFYYRIPAAHYVKLIPIFERFGLSTDYLVRLMSSLQRGDGAFHCHPATRYAFTHFHCYACDGIEDRFPERYESAVSWFADNLMDDEPILPAWTSDRSWTMPGANLQAAYHLNNVGETHLANRIRDHVLSVDQTPGGGIPIKNDGPAESWCTLFLLLYDF